MDEGTWTRLDGEEDWERLGNEETLDDGDCTRLDGDEHWERFGKWVMRRLTWFSKTVFLNCQFWKIFLTK